MKYPATVFGLIMLAFPAFSQADPWVYAKGQQSISVFYVSETFDDVWIMGNEVHIETAEVDQKTLWLRYNRGLTDTMTLNVTTGLTQSQTQGNDLKYDGLADSKVGLNWQLLNENEGFPVTLSLSFAGTLKGTYDRPSAANPYSPGDKANALEGSVNIATAVGSAAVVAEYGYRARFNDVPDEFFYGVGITGNVLPSLSLTARYQVTDSRGDLDILGPGFTPDRYHETAEDFDGYSINATWSLGSGHSINGGIANVLEGTNTGNSDVFFLGYSYSF